MAAMSHMRNRCIEEKYSSRSKIRITKEMPQGREANERSSTRERSISGEIASSKVEKHKEQSRV